MDKQDLIAKDKQYLWHPFTPMHEWLADTPLIIERAEGNYLIDTDGNCYLDGVSSLWVNVFGHQRKEIDAAIRHQLDRVAHSTLLGLANVPSIQLAEKLIQIAPPGLAKVFYSDSGSAAVEIALKMAYQYWCHKGHPEKKKFIALENAYHGDTLGAVSVGGIDPFHKLFQPFLFPVIHVPSPYWYRCPQAPDPTSCRDYCLGILEQTLAEHGNETAALILEPLVQGAAGMIVHPYGFLHGAAKLCRQYNVLLICDEVATGFGRTGTMFACSQEDVSPDLMCVAKGLTGGYLPLAATLSTEDIFLQFIGSSTNTKTFFHGHSYTGNPLACAAALACLKVFDKEGMIDKISSKISYLSSHLAADIMSLMHVGQVRQKGLMVGIELVADRTTKAPYPSEMAIGHRVCRRLRKEGVILRPLGPVVALMPPLSITPAEISLLVTKTRQAIIDETEPHAP